VVGENVITHFNFDDLDPNEPARVRDELAPDDRDRDGLLRGTASVIVEAGQNAPTMFDPLDTLSAKLVCYLPMDDGRSTNRLETTSVVEDYMNQGDMRFAGSFSNAFLNIDFGQYTGASAFDPSNPYWDFEQTYPRLFPIPQNSPWRTDSDKDGMPDAFEAYYGMDPNRESQPENPDMEATRDLDDDGLINLYEYYAGTDPAFHDSDENGITDSDDDNDGDGVSNGDEQLLGSHPLRVDTDDDGFADGVEIDGPMFANPVNSMDPKAYTGVTNGVGDRRYAFKSMVLDGGRYEVPRPLNEVRRFNSESWTVEGWVRITNAVATATLFKYEGVAYSNTTAIPITYYEIGFEGGVPYVATQTGAGRVHRCYGQPLPLNRWVHLTGLFDAE